MDQIDHKIIQELTKNAQTPFTKIAKQIGISSETVGERYKKMIKDGTITLNTISIDLSKIGYQAKIFLMITNKSSQDKLTTKDALRKMKNIFLVTDIVDGDIDVLAIAAIVDLDHAFAMVNEIRELSSVERVGLTIVKDTSFPVNNNFNAALLRKEP